jgi:phosphoribosylglycinamide formyltransferase-1
VGINLAPDAVVWEIVDSRLANSWELAAPRRLLEMGGR